MNRLPTDQGARERFADEWRTNFGVAANAGSGKTTAISERLAAMALSPAGGELLARTAVVTYTKKAAAQIVQRARAVLIRRMGDAGTAGPAPLARLDEAFFGTIHSFCLVLARRHGSALGVHLNPRVLDDGESAHWQEFLEEDPMNFAALGPAPIGAFLRHAPLDDVFELARELDAATARRLVAAAVPQAPPPPPQGVLDEILAATARKGSAAAALARNQETALRWVRRFGEERGPLPIPKPEGTAAGIPELYRRLFAPLKGWLAGAGGALAAELSLRYRSWRLDRGLQTYADQVETAVALLEDAEMLERIRGEGWRVVLDEAQDADPKQLAVLVEITRPRGAPRGTWPSGGGAGPRPGHFCMVGDAQQSIYSGRADIRNFQAHLDALAAGGDSERLTFDVTFRTPRRVARLLNDSLPAAFGPGRRHNLGLPAEPGAPERLFQVAYEPLEPGPGNPEGGAWRLPLAAAPDADGRGAGDRRLADEARQLARFLAANGPAAVKAAEWGEVCVMAPRVAWLPIICGELEAAGLRVALQLRQNRSGDNPVYAWLSGLLAVVCDPENTFEWVGVLREVFAVSDSVIAGAVGGGRPLRWDEPEAYAAPVREALAALGPFLARADGEGESIGRFAAELADACALAAKARLADPDGSLGDELGRLLARADELGAAGAGPRQWLRELLDSSESRRAAGRPAADAINLMTSHSAKGVEWPVVIPVGLWRAIGFQREAGLRLLPGAGAPPTVVFDNDAVSAEARDSDARGRQRELVRLLYVTLTRCQRALVVPWPEGAEATEGSFAELWGLDPGALEPLPAPDAACEAKGAPPAAAPAPEAAAGGGAQAPRLPARILPHELAHAPDRARGALHEAAAEVPAPARDAADPLEYGIWWHGMLETVPWSGDPDAVARHGSAWLGRAKEMGFGPRGGEEWERLLGSEPWRLMREPRWRRLAEVGVLAPYGAGAWIDGVVDLVLHDPDRAEAWVVDWKTNRRGSSEDDAALLHRLGADYGGQLSAYGRCAGAFFPGCRVRLWVYSTVAGAWTEVAGTA